MLKTTPARVTTCAGVIAVFAAVTPIFTPAFAGNGANWVLYNHHTEDQGETEVKIFSDFSDADYAAQLFEIEYGVTDRLTTALYFEGVHLDDENYDFGGWRFETRYRLFDYGAFPLNPVLYIEYEQLEPEHRFIRSVKGRTDGGDDEEEEEEEGTEYELETKLLLGHDFSDRFNVAFNWINEVNLDNGNWSFGYALGFNYTLFHAESGESAAEDRHLAGSGWSVEKVKVGAELYGGLGDDSLGLTLDADKTEQYLGLNLQGEFENHVSFGIGGAFGLTDDAEDAILRLMVGYEFE